MSSPQFPGAITPANASNRSRHYIEPTSDPYRRFYARTTWNMPFNLSDTEQSIKYLVHKLLAVEGTKPKMGQNCSYRIDKMISAVGSDHFKEGWKDRMVLKPESIIYKYGLDAGLPLWFWLYLSGFVSDKQLKPWKLNMYVRPEDMKLAPAKWLNIKMLQYVSDHSGINPFGPHPLNGELVGHPLGLGHEDVRGLARFLSGCAPTDPDPLFIFPTTWDHI